MSDTLTYEEQRSIGKASEETFFAFAEKVNNEEIVAPEWLCRIDRPTGHEDCARGADAIAVTDRGRIPVQIKSSKRFIDKFWENHPGFPGFILIVYPKANETVFGLKFLRELKHHYHSRERHDF